MFCPRCGQTLLNSTEIFCSNCGAEIPAQQNTQHSTYSKPPSINITNRTESGPYSSPSYGSTPLPEPGKGEAIASLVTGLLGLLCLGIILGPVGIFLALSARKKGYIGGIGTAGLVISIITTALYVLLILFYILMIAMSISLGW